MKTNFTNVGNQLRRSLAAIVLALVAPSLALGQSGRLSHELETLSANPSENKSVDVIVQYRVAPTDSHYSRVSARGGSLHVDLHTVKAGAFHVPANHLADIANDPDVLHVSLDRPIKARTYSSNPDLYEYSVNAQYAWSQNYTGAGIGIAVIDSGVTNDGDFSNIVYNQSFVPGQTSNALDAYGHGSHVAGIVAGNGTHSSGSFYNHTFIGVANGANIVNLRVLDQNGASSDSVVIAAIQKAIQLKNTYNIRVINLSLGRGVFESYTQDPLCQAVEAAWKAGIVVVVAAGNDGRNNSAGTNGYGTINAPGNDPYVITVGAMKSSGTAGRSGDQVASYSSKGPTLFDHIVKPDIVAPGNHVISVLGSPGATLFGSIDALAGTSYTNCGSCTWTSTHYFYLSGTSMATPVVSGAAALVLQQNPWMTPDQVKARLMKTSYKSLPRWSWAQNSDTGQWYENQDDVFTVGAGYLDVQAALQNNDLAPWYVGSAMSPVVNTNWWGGTYLVPSATVIGGNSVLWGSTQVFGQSVLWGTLNSNQSLLSLVSSVTGSSVLWGSVDSAVLGSSVLWGSLNNASDNSQSIEVAGEN